MQKSFDIKGRNVVCEIIRSQRRTVSMNVNPDRSVTLKVPCLVTVDAIEQFLLKHSRWLFNRLDAIEKKPVEPKKYVTGELHYFLGQQYPLEVISSSENKLVFEDDTFFLYTENVKYNESIFVDWYAKHAMAIFKECGDPLVEQMKKYNIYPKSFTIKKMKTRWGSCSSRGSISLNLDLIKLPKECIKAVILHELCHLVHMNHSKEFYALMTAEMPDWKVWDKQLRFL